MNSLQASLPRVLFGNNGRLIRSPEQLEEAQKRLTAILDETTGVRQACGEYLRVDLVLHFKCDVKKFIVAHRHCRHPLIRRETVEYGVNGLKLHGAEASVCFYDKSYEMGFGPGDILRLELQLRKPKLNEIFGKKDAPVLSLDFSTCYRIYRMIVCELKPVPIAPTFGFNTLLAHCEAGGFTLANGLSAMEAYRATVSRDTFLAKRRQIKGMILTAAGIDWSELLPEKRLPEVLPDADFPEGIISGNN